MATSILNRKYWAGGYHFGNDNQFNKFISTEKWKIGWELDDKEGKLFYKRINEVKIGDFFALKSFGGSYDLTISALGIVIDTTEKLHGELQVKWLRFGKIYKGKAPRGAGAGNWFGTLLEIKREDDIIEIFNPLLTDEQKDQQSIRTLTANSNAFDFWNDEAEDIYQDYLKEVL